MDPKAEREQRKAVEKILGHKVTLAELRALRAMGALLALYVLLKDRWGPNGPVQP